MSNHQFKNFITTLSNNIYHQLGSGHSESIYQKALLVELHTQGFMVNGEFNIPVKYEDSKGRLHNLASERIDVYIHKDPDSVFKDIQESDIILELKATGKFPGYSETEQVKKYLRQFKSQGYNVPYGIVINFPQPTTSGISDDVHAVLVELPQPEPPNPPVQPRPTVVVNES